MANEIIKQWHNEGHIPTQESVDKYGVEIVRAYVNQCAQRIADNTPLDCDSWDDPEEWQMEAVVVAHGVILLDSQPSESGE